MTKSRAVASLKCKVDGSLGNNSWLQLSINTNLTPHAKFHESLIKLYKMVPPEFDMDKRQLELSLWSKTDRNQ